MTAIRRIGALCVLLLPAGPLLAAEAASELYRISTLRAAPGALLDVIALYADAQAAGHWQRSGDAEPMLMRHSQGDQWDLLVLQPLGSYADYYARKRIEARTAAGAAALDDALDALVGFREDLLAWGPPRAQVESAWRDNAFYHIEMFAALAGKHAELLHERQMENAYLVAIKGKPNLIFVGDQGSDVDVVTIGFYPSIVEFAAPPAVGDAETEAAAKAAGFKGRAFIGTYLRELIAAHHDTLAIKAP